MFEIIFHFVYICIFCHLKIAQIYKEKRVVQMRSRMNRFQLSN